MKKILVNGLLGTAICLAITTTSFATGPKSDFSGINKPLQDSTMMNKKGGKMKNKSGNMGSDSTGMNHDKMNKGMKGGKKGMKSMDSTGVR